MLVVFFFPLLYSPRCKYPIVSWGRQSANEVLREFIAICMEEQVGAGEYFVCAALRARTRHVASLFVQLQLDFFSRFWLFLEEGSGEKRLVV